MIAVTYRAEPLKPTVRKLPDSVNRNHIGKEKIIIKVIIFTEEAFVTLCGLQGGPQY